MLDMVPAKVAHETDSYADAEKLISANKAEKVEAEAPPPAPKKPAQKAKE